MNSTNLKVLTFITALILGGCGSLPTYVAYEGSRKNGDLESLILGNSDKDTLLPGHKRLISIFCVNGKSTEASFFSTAAYKYPFEAAVLPGRNYIGAVYSQGRSFSLSSFWLEAVEGRTYTIGSYVIGDRVKFSVSDSKGEAVIGGFTSQNPETNLANGSCDAELENAKRNLSTPLYIYVPAPM